MGPAIGDDSVTYSASCDRQELELTMQRLTVGRLVVGGCCYLHQVILMYVYIGSDNGCSMAK
jgi:hypothetical protein